MKKVISGRAHDRRDTYPQLTVLHDNRIHDISHILAAVGAVLQESVDVTPGDDLERILAVDMQVAHSVDVELIGLGLNGVDLDDQLAQGLGLATIRSFMARQASVTLWAMTMASGWMLWMLVK